MRIPLRSEWGTRRMRSVLSILTATHRRRSWPESHVSYYVDIFVWFFLWTFIYVVNNQWTQKLHADKKMLNVIFIFFRHRREGAAFLLLPPNVYGLSWKIGRGFLTVRSNTTLLKRYNRFHQQLALNDDCGRFPKLFGQFIARMFFGTVNFRRLLLTRCYLNLPIRIPKTLTIKRVLNILK